MVNSQRFDNGQKSPLLLLKDLNEMVICSVLISLNEMFKYSLAFKKKADKEIELERDLKTLIAGLESVVSFVRLISIHNGNITASRRFVQSEV